jgi:dihydroorotase
MKLDDRRSFLKTGLAWTAASTWPLVTGSSIAAVEKFDLLIRNAQVLDPSQNLNGLRDIGIRHGKIAAVAANLPTEGAARVMDAQRQWVTPGLIDLHCHTYPYGSGIGIPADELMVHQATTTTVSAGDAGANNFAAWRRFVQPASRTRQFAFVHIAVIGLAGFPVPELANIQYAQPEIAARTLAENADLVLGIKVRMSENVIARHGMEPLRRAISACDMSGVPKAKVMVHIGGVSDRALMSQILDALRPGDILTHCYSGATNLAGDGTNIVQDGKLLPAALEAKKRGVLFDVGHGGGSFDYTIAEAAMAQGCMPDTLSSDAHAVSANTPGKPYLPWVMSKFLNMGFSLNEVVKMATLAPAQVIQRIPLHGTLQLGAPADLSMLELVEGPVEFVDTMNHRRSGKLHLKPLGTVIAGVVSGRPYQAPFSVR